MSWLDVAAMIAVAVLLLGILAIPDGAHFWLLVP